MRPVLDPGRNCWRRVHASRVAFLVDAASYYRAFMRAAERAEHSIVVVGWDFDSRTSLEPGRGRRSPRLGTFLRQLVERKPSLSVHVLAWDYSLIYTFERELLPTLNTELRGHQRLEFRLDDNHPRGASHHQKVVVIDDRVAFAGGIDLALRRWDTPDHRPDDARRVDPAGEPYGPFHDVQVAVDGEVASALADLLRWRWRRAGGVDLPVTEISGDPWPDGLAPDLRDVEVAIARTAPPHRDEPAIREVEALFHDSIAAAERFLYVENQYLTSRAVASSLAASLERPRGPEIVILGPGRASGWLEENTMSVLRARVVAELRRADRSGRLRLYYPVVDGTFVSLHDKVVVADDVFLRIGSANLSSRSMALDTECDLAIEASGARASDVRRGIAALRRRLIAEHLGLRVADVERAEARAVGSLIGAIESCRGGKRTLADLLPSEQQTAGELLPDAALIDPMEPLATVQVIDRLLPDSIKASRGSPLPRLAVIVVGLAGVAVLWHLTPAGEVVNVERLLAATRAWRGSPFAPLALAATFVFGNLLLVPVTVLLIQSGIIFGPVLGALYGAIGAHASAAFSFWLGRVAGHEAVERFLSSHVRRIGHPLGRRNIFIVAALRLVPVGPYALVNIAFGASRVRFRYFMAGTLIGMAPGILALSAFGYQLGEALVRPSIASYLVLGGVAAVFAGAGWWIRRRILARAEQSHAAGE